MILQHSNGGVSHRAVALVTGAVAAGQVWEGATGSSCDTLGGRGGGEGKEEEEVKEEEEEEEGEEVQKNNLISRVPTAQQVQAAHELRTSTM